MENTSNSFLRLMDRYLEGLIFQGLNMQFPLTGSIELAEIYSLPCPQEQRASFYYHTLIRTEETRLHMGSRIALHVSESTVLRDQALKLIYHVCRDSRVGVLVDGDGRGCMRNMDET